MPEGYTEQDLALLNPAERAIIEADETDDSDLEALRALADDGSDDTPAAGATAKPDAAAADDKPGNTNTDDDTPSSTDLVFTPETPADAEKLRADLTTRKDEAFQKLMDGELEPAEYKKIEKEVDGELEKLLQATITDNVTTKLTQAQIAKAWDAEVKTAMKTAATEGLDYAKNAELQTEFDGLVRVFGAEASQRCMSEEGLKASKWALQQAHATMKMRHADLVKAPATGDGKPGKTGAREKPDLSVIPPTLSRAPIAAGASVSDEFAHLEGLKGAEMEKAIARLTPDQQDRYLST